MGPQPRATDDPIATPPTAAALGPLLLALSDPSGQGWLSADALARVATAVGADEAVLATASQSVLYPHAPDEAADDRGDPLPLPDGAHRALLTGRSTRSDGSAGDARPSDERAAATAWVPLGSGQGRRELLVLRRAGPRPFTDDDLSLLDALARHLDMTLELHQRNTALEQLATWGHRLVHQRDLDGVFEVAADLIRDITAGDRAGVVSIEDGTATLRAHRDLPPAAVASWPRPVDRVNAWPSALRGEPYVVTADAGDPLGSVTAGASTGPESRLAVPVMRDGVPVALLYAIRSGHAPLTPNAIVVAEALAAHVGAAMLNAELYASLVQREQQLSWRATHDPLTELANRELARTRLDAALTAEAPGQVGVLFCDLDGFKAINDRLGHEAGDEVLKEVAVRLAGCAGPHDLLARLGGDEFLFVLDGVADLDAVADVGARALSRLSAPLAIGGERASIGASFGGVVGRRGSGVTSSELMRDADAAMYEAKARGRNRIELFDADAARRAVERLELRSDLRHAVDARQLRLEYQPVVRLDDGVVVGVEALVRWHHPVRGVIGPAEFIPLAEETGDIVDIGRWVAWHAAAQLARWREGGNPHLRVSVNLSPHQLQRPELAAELRAAVDTAGVPAAALLLEITESAELSGAAAALGELGELGFPLALDDFGMSYSNLANLRDMPIRWLKIDRTFVAGLPTDHVDTGIVRAVMALSSTLDVQVVAEGVETEAQRRALLEVGCRYGQGYLWGRPASAEEMTGRLDEMPRLRWRPQASIRPSPGSHRKNPPSAAAVDPVG